MLKKLIILSLFFVCLASTTTYAETKIGVVKLDVLFKEIPVSYTHLTLPTN